MDRRPSHDAVVRLLRLLGERLERHLEGDALALDALGDALEQHRFTPDEIEAAVHVLRSPVHEAGTGDTTGQPTAPGRNTHRVLSAEERASLTPEAWGYLLDLRRHGSLDAAQVERVLDLLTGSGVRPIGVDLARETALRVALDVETSGEPGDLLHGDVDLAH